MKRLVLLFMLLASPAHAATAHRYVTTTGAGGHTGVDLANAWSLAEANASASGDMQIHMSDGTYATAINPANEGDSTAANLVYLGNLSDPAAVTTSGGILISKKDFITVRNVRTTGEFRVADAYRDSFFNVNATNEIKTGIQTVNTAINDSSIVRCWFEGGTWSRTTNPRHWIADGMRYCHFRNINITQSFSGTGIDETRSWLLDDGNGGTDSCYFVGIKQTISVDSGADFANECAWRFFYDTRNSYFIDCRLTIDDDGPDGAFALGFRGSTSLSGNVRFLRDTILDVGSGASGSRVAVSGNQPINDLFFTNCVYYLMRKFHPNFSSSRWAFSGCVIVCRNLLGSESSGGGAHMFENSTASGSSSNLTFDHCSIYYMRNGRNPEGGFFSDQISTSTVGITNSLVMVRQTHPTSLDPSCNAQRVLSQGSGGASGRIDYNVYYRIGGAAADSNKAVSQDGGVCSPVGPNTGSGTSCQSWSQNCHSRWGGSALNQMVVDTTWNPGSITGPKPDLRPMPGGLIVHSMWPDGYVGAFAPASAVQPAAVDSFYALPQYPSAAGRIPVVLTWFRPATASSDSPVFIRMYNKSVAQLNPASQTEAAWWDSARVIGEHPFRYRGFVGPDGWIVTSPDDSIGFHNSREIGGSDALYTTPSGVLDGAVNTATDLWFGIRYRVNNGPLSPTRYAYMDPDSSLRIFTAATPPVGAVNVGQNVGGTVVWWYKPNNVTSYQIRVGAGLLTESGWSTATVVPLNLPQNDSVHPPGTIHYARVQPPNCGSFTAAAKYVNPYFTGNVSNLSAISGPVPITCGN